MAKRFDAFGIIINLDTILVMALVMANTKQVQALEVANTKLVQAQVIAQEPAKLAFEQGFILIRVYSKLAFIILTALSILFQVHYLFT